MSFIQRLVVGVAVVGVFASFTATRSFAQGNRFMQFEPALDQPPVELSTAPVEGTDGRRAFKGRISRTTYQTTPTSGVYETALIVVYDDASGPEVWDWDGARHAARDLFVTRSLDGGATWSRPINLTGSAALSTATADPDGAGPLPPQPYHGSVDKSAMVTSGKQVVVSYGSYYCPTERQGLSTYVDGAEAVIRTVPFTCMYAVRSGDAGASWSAPQRLSDGSRHAMNVNAKQGPAGFGLVWQEDPGGLKPGEGEGPGDGGSGSSVNGGTDVWYAGLDRSTFATGFLPPARVSNNVTTMGEGGESGDVGAARPGLTFVGRTVAVVYEEQKGAGGGTGRYVRYHTFDGLSYATMPVIVPGGEVAVIADGTLGAGFIISDPARSARRPRINSQDTPGSSTGAMVMVLYREGLSDSGGAADTMGRVGAVRPGVAGSDGARAADLWPAVSPDAVTGTGALGNSHALNLSSSAGLTADTEADAAENARGHRAILRGDAIVMAYHYTPDDVASRIDGTANYNLFLRRSFDGGRTWDARRDLSKIADPSINVREPRLIPTPRSPDPAEAQATDIYHIAWGTSTNPRASSGEAAVNLGVYYTRTTNFGETYEPVQELTDHLGLLGDESENEESQMQSEPSGKQVHVIWMQTDPDSGADDVAYRRGAETSGPDCTGNYLLGDRDEDGVCDDLDQCTGDDARGDRDEDGICEDLDQCTGTDALGDGDGDGVCDDRDLCLGHDSLADPDGDGVCGFPPSAADDDGGGCCSGGSGGTSAGLALLLLGLLARSRGRTRDRRGPVRR